MRGFSGFKHSDEKGAVEPSGTYRGHAEGEHDPRDHRHPAMGSATDSWTGNREKILSDRAEEEQAHASEVEESMSRPLIERKQEFDEFMKKQEAGKDPFKMKKPWGRRSVKKKVKFNWKGEKDEDFSNLSAREKRREISWAQGRQMDFALERGDVKNEKQAERLKKRSKRIKKRMSKP